MLHFHYSLWKLIISLVILTGLLLGIIWFGPGMLALHRQVVGGRLLEQALAGMENGEAIACSLEALPDGEGQEQVEKAVSSLKAALAYRQTLSQALLLLGRANCLLGQTDSAVEYLLAYSNLRPKNPLGHMESGFVYERIGQKEQAVLEWVAAGITWQDFFLNGERARHDKQYSQAIYWFQRANWLTPEAGDPYYAAGMAYQSQGDWEQAISSYRAALAAGLFQDIHPGDVYYRLGLVYQSDSEYRSLDMALEMYHNALTLEAQSSEGIQAEVHYKIGEIYLWQGRDVVESIAEYRQALTLNPSHHWAHLRLGRALYDAYHDVTQAEVEVFLAVDL